MKSIAIGNHHKFVAEFGVCAYELDGASYHGDLELLCFLRHDDSTNKYVLTPEFNLNFLLVGAQVQPRRFSTSQ